MNPMQATDAFIALMGEREEEIPLDTACLLIAAHAHADDAAPGVVAGGQADLDAIAAGCPGGSIDDVRSHLFDTLGFRGNRKQYDDARNSYLDMVIARRLGIPISLAVLTIEVGRRLGLALAPIGMPGHFMVGIGDGLYLDAFESGRVIDTDGCRLRLAELGGIPWNDDLVDPIGTHAVLARVLANLRRQFADQQDLLNLDWVLQLRSSIPGVPHRERAERAAVLTALGRYDTAASELERLATIEETTRHPSGGTSTAGAETALDLRRQAARLRAKLN